MKTVTFVQELMRRAALVGQARKSGDAEALAKAEAYLEEYKDLILMSDETRL